MHTGNALVASTSASSKRLVPGALLSTAVLLVSGLLLPILVISVDAQSQAGSLHFYGEDEFPKQVKLSKAMERALRNDPIFPGCYARERDRTQVTNIDAGRSAAREILIKVECGNSNATFWFWLLKKEGNAYRPVMRVATMGIDFLRKRTRGHRDVYAVGCNANTCLHEYFTFSDRRYVRSRRWTRPSIPLPLK
jgi:hypothetical protein